MFKHKEEAVPIIDQDLTDDGSNNQSGTARRRIEREQMKIRTRYKARLVVKGFEQQLRIPTMTKHLERGTLIFAITSPEKPSRTGPSGSNTFERPI